MDVKLSFQLSFSEPLAEFNAGLCEPGDVVREDETTDGRRLGDQVDIVFDSVRRGRIYRSKSVGQSGVKKWI